MTDLDQLRHALAKACWETAWEVRVRLNNSPTCPARENLLAAVRPLQTIDRGDVVPGSVLITATRLRAAMRDIHGTPVDTLDVRTWTTVFLREADLLTPTPSKDQP